MAPSNAIMTRKEPDTELYCLKDKCRDKKDMCAPCDTSGPGVRNTEASRYEIEAVAVVTNDRGLDRVTWAEYVSTCRDTKCSHVWITLKVEDF
ncbi:hypothetical protein J6590_071628 [Homalodisca vitripennis]|nr:hypothetical protein J6590_071628 [Homalodisca vitripennis]